MEALSNAKNYIQEKLKNSNLNYELSIKTELKNAIISLSDKKNNKSAQVTIQKALHSELQKKYSLSDNQVNSSVIINEAAFLGSNSQDLLPLLSYFALRQARIWQCQNIITEKNTYPLLKFESISYAPSLFAQRLQYASYQAYEACDEIQKSFIQSYYADEIIDTFESWVISLFQDSWFQAIKTKTLSKEQYISTLFNLHSFVKHTTRLAARCVAFCESRELRNHYIHHLKGEINHEVIIESDLKALRADVNYLTQSYVPHAATSEFIVLQESITGFRQDALLMLACPFVAEGMTANISSQFVDDLYANIKNWGIKSPESVSRFLTSHMKTDGGDDGHWMRVIMMMDKFIKTEQQFQQFLNVLQLAMSGYAHGLNENIHDCALWQAPSHHTNQVKKAALAENLF